VGVAPGRAVSFAVSAPSTATPGSPVSVAVTARDADGNTATGYAGTVHFSSSDPTAVLPTDATLASGAGTFAATFTIAGAQTITATDTATASITGASGPWTWRRSPAPRRALPPPAGCSLPGLGINVDDVVGIASTGDGQGYWLVAADGGVLSCFGDAPLYGSTGGGSRTSPAVGLVSAPDGAAYSIIFGDGADSPKADSAGRSSQTGASKLTSLRCCDCGTPWGRRDRSGGRAAWTPAGSRAH
jgi:hypothetical protein